MKLHCRSVRKALKSFHEGSLSAELAGAMQSHLCKCPACRGAAYRQGLTNILRCAAAAPVPEPPDSFMAGLKAAVWASAVPKPAPAMAELLARAGLRLAPAMAAMALVASFSGAWLSEPARDTPVIVPAEELLLEDHPLSTDLILAALHGETIER
jgi:anti-sigma factor RsiW